jgi:hypothetical protein
MPHLPFHAPVLLPEALRFARSIRAREQKTARRRIAARLIFPELAAELSVRSRHFKKNRPVIISVGGQAPWNALST